MNAYQTRKTFSSKQVKYYIIKYVGNLKTHFQKRHKTNKQTNIYLVKGKDKHKLSSKLSVQ